MTLPYLKPKQIAGLIISHRKSDAEGQQKQEDSDDSNAALESCAEDLIRAIHAKDAKAVAAAWKAGMDCMESSSDSDESYDSQNEKAAEYSKE